MSELQFPHQAELPLQLPPVDVVRYLAENLEPGEPRTILDVGTGTGRNAAHLARQGHFVVALDNQFSEVQQAAQLFKSGKEQAANCSFVVGDLRRPLFLALFDIVLCNEVLHLMSKRAAQEMLTAIRALTKQGGLNVVSSYLLAEGTGNARNRERCLQPEELRDHYQAAGWDILYYRELYLPLRHSGAGPMAREIVSSRAKIIAQRRWLPAPDSEPEYAAL